MFGVVGRFRLALLGKLPTYRPVEKAIDRLKPSKSQGPDNIHPKLVKECKKSIITPLTMIIKKSLQESVLPSIWKQANVTAIYKKGPRTKPQNYRPISLTSVPCKLMERIIRGHIVEHMTRNDFLVPFSMVSYLVNLV